MRYRRLSYRYALVLAAGQPRPLGPLGPAEQLGVWLAQPRWRPPADVYETVRTITVAVELAGVEQDELDVVLYEDALVVEGQRRLPMFEAGGVYHAAEIRQGPFRLELPLPAAIDPERVDARYERGLLQITLAKVDGRETS
ncbi:MAG: Hsp20/alpha crystallin family protein [Chloroflexi bacterium]|nr:Hsp20/alpha crystallin family protein [Chloroflexota bacterium]